MVGSGPAGLALAIHAKPLGLSAIVLERGHLAENVSRYPKELVFFSLRGDMEIAGLPCDSPRTYPTREDYLSYLLRAVRFTGIELHEETAFVRLSGADGDFTVLAARRGREVTYRARKVVLATGVFGQPRRLTIPGSELAKVAYCYDDLYRYRRQRVAIVGAGNGAAEAALRLTCEADAEVTVLNRAPSLRALRWRWAMPDLANLVESGAIRVIHDATIEAIDEGHIWFTSRGAREGLRNDHVLVQAGYVPDTTVFAGAGVRWDERGAPALDVRTLESNVPGVFVSGTAVTTQPDSIFVRGSRNHAKVILDGILGRPRKAIEDLGSDTLEHWLQFEAPPDPLDADLAAELVPELTGEFPHQLIDLYQPVLMRHNDGLDRAGVRPSERFLHRPDYGSVVDSLPPELLENLTDGTVRFKGHEFDGVALAILRLADGTRRIREIVAEVHEEAVAAGESDTTVANFILDLLRIGKLVWRPAPRGPAAR